MPKQKGSLITDIKGFNFPGKTLSDLYSMCLENTWELSNVLLPCFDEDSLNIQGTVLFVCPKSIHLEILLYLPNVKAILFGNGNDMLLALQDYNLELADRCEIVNAKDQEDAAEKAAIYAAQASGKIAVLKGDVKTATVLSPALRHLRIIGKQISHTAVIWSPTLQLLRGVDDPLHLC